MSESTIRNLFHHLRVLDHNNVDVDDPVEVVEWLKKCCRWSETGKKILYSFYKMYTMEIGLTVEDMKFEWVKKIPFVPSEEMLGAVINAARNFKMENRF